MDFFTPTAAQSGITTLLGAAYEQEGNLAYHPFIEAIDRYLAEQRLAPEQNPITYYRPLGVTDPQQGHTALFKATATFFATLAGNGPVLILVDDLHAADEASLSMFHYLARQARSMPVILLAPYRTDIAISRISPFGSLLNALYREHLSKTIDLSPLPEGAAAQIIHYALEGQAAQGLVKAIFDAAEGNPFYIQEISRSMLRDLSLAQEDNEWRLQAGATLQIPAGLQGLLRERVQRLGEGVEATLTAAAVVGRDFHFAVLRHITGLPDNDLFDTLDAAFSAHLLTETDAGYRFQHSLIRHALYTSLSRRRRAWLHTRTAQAIEDIYSRQADGLESHIEALAYHYDLSDQREKALPYLTHSCSFTILATVPPYLGTKHLGIDDPARRWSLLEQLGTWAKVLADTSRGRDVLRTSACLTTD